MLKMSVDWPVLHMLRCVLFLVCASCCPHTGASVEPPGSAGLEPAVRPPPGRAGTEARWRSRQREAGAAVLQGRPAGRSRQALPHGREEGHAEPQPGLVHRGAAHTAGRHHRLYIKDGLQSDQFITKPQSWICHFSEWWFLLRCRCWDR